MPYLSNEDFKVIYGKVPRLNVDLFIRSDKGVLLALRSIEPYLNCWHMPGGTVYITETVEEASIRIAKRETGLEVKVGECKGYLEFPHEQREGVAMHTISIVMEVSPLTGVVTHDNDAKELKWFQTMPDSLVDEHEQFLKENLI